MRNGQTELDEDDFEDLRFPVGGRGSNYALIREEQTQGTSAGTFTSGAWQKRTLNVEAADTGDHASLSASQITLEAGTYRLRAGARVFGRRAPAPVAERHRRGDDAGRDGGIRQRRADAERGRRAIYDQREQDVRASAPLRHDAIRRRLGGGGQSRGGSVRAGRAVAGVIEITKS
ncbi:MAG: hypothetical protein U0521_17185 [Anaerolineae bacterium]